MGNIILLDGEKDPVDGSTIGTKEIVERMEYLYNNLSRSSELLQRLANALVSLEGRVKKLEGIDNGK